MAIAKYRPSFTEVQLRTMHELINNAIGDVEINQTVLMECRVIIEPMLWKIDAGTDSPAYVATGPGRPGISHNIVSPKGAREDILKGMDYRNPEQRIRMQQLCVKKWAQYGWDSLSDLELNMCLDGRIAAGIELDWGFLEDIKLRHMMGMIGQEELQGHGYEVSELTGMVVPGAGIAMVPVSKPNIWSKLEEENGVVSSNEVQEKKSLDNPWNI